MLMPQQGQAPQAAAGPADRQGQGRDHGHLRRLRDPGPRAGLDHRPPDRGRPYRDDPPRQAWRQGLDPHLPDKPVTQKPAETRMGSGKGNPEHWVAVVKPGRILFELAGVNEALGRGRHGAGDPEAADQGPVRRAGQQEEVEVEMTKRKRAARADRRRARRQLVEAKQSCSTCASSWRPASSTTRPARPGPREMPHRRAARARDRGRRGGPHRRSVTDDGEISSRDRPTEASETVAPSAAVRRERRR